MRSVWKSKRGEGEERTQEAPNYSIYFLIVAIIVPLFAIFLVIATSSYSVETTSILGNLESAVVGFRILNSPECFVYQDEATKRTYPHTIELKKCTPERLEACMGNMSGVCFKSQIKVGGEVMKELQSRNYRRPSEIKVSVWPIKAKDEGEERQGFMIISTSKQCG